MKRETIDSYTKWSGRPFKALAHIDADVMIEFAEYFADEQLKKNMPSDEEIEDAADKLFPEYVCNGIGGTELNSDYKTETESFFDGVRWLKQQILKP